MMQSFIFGPDCSKVDSTRIRWTKGNHRDSSIRQRWPRDYSRASSTPIHIPTYTHPMQSFLRHRLSLRPQQSGLSLSLKLASALSTACYWYIIRFVLSTSCPSLHCTVLLTFWVQSRSLLVDLKIFTPDSSEDSLVLD